MIFYPLFPVELFPYFSPRGVRGLLAPADGRRAAVTPVSLSTKRKPGVMIPGRAQDEGSWQP